MAITGMPQAMASRVARCPPPCPLEVCTRHLEAFKRLQTDSADCSGNTNAPWVVALSKQAGSCSWNLPQTKDFSFKASVISHVLFHAAQVACCIPSQIFGWICGFIISSFIPNALEWGIPNRSHVSMSTWLSIKTWSKSLTAIASTSPPAYKRAFLNGRLHTLSQFFLSFPWAVAGDSQYRTQSGLNDSILPSGSNRWTSCFLPMICIVW